MPSQKVKKLYEKSNKFHKLDKLLWSQNSIQKSKEKVKNLLKKVRKVKISFILNVGKVPKDCCFGWITPAYKEGSKVNPDSYRGMYHECASKGLIPNHEPQATKLSHLKQIDP